MTTESKIPSPRAFAAEPRESKREAEVLSALRQLSQEERFEFVWRVLDENEQLGLVLARRAQLSPFLLEVLLRRGLVYADASSVRYWLEAVVDGLGKKAVLNTISWHVDNAPLCVFKTLYWLKPLGFPAADVALLQSAFDKAHPGFNSKRSVGTHSS